jgi:hypothetical protein
MGHDRVRRLLTCHAQTGSRTPRLLTRHVATPLLSAGAMIPAAGWRPKRAVSAASTCSATAQQEHNSYNVYHLRLRSHLSKVYTRRTTKQRKARQRSPRQRSPRSDAISQAQRTATSHLVKSSLWHLVPFETRVNTRRSKQPQCRETIQCHHGDSCVISPVASQREAAYSASGSRVACTILSLRPFKIADRQE